MNRRIPVAYRAAYQRSAYRYRHFIIASLRRFHDAAERRDASMMPADAALCLDSATRRHGRPGGDGRSNDDAIARLRVIDVAKHEAGMAIERRAPLETGYRSVQLAAYRRFHAAARFIVTGASARRRRYAAFDAPAWPAVATASLYDARRSIHWLIIHLLHRSLATALPIAGSSRRDCRGGIPSIGRARYAADDHRPLSPVTCT